MAKFFLQKRIRWVHGRLALAVGLLFLLISWTGAALVFEQDILRLLHPEHYRVEKVSDAPLAVDELMDRVAGQMPPGCFPGSLTVFPDPEATWQLEIANLRSAVLFVDPYTGRVVGMHNEDSGGFYWLRRLHRWLLFDYKRGSGEFCLGKFLVGSVTLVSVSILLSGLWAWMPRSWQMLRRRLAVKAGAGRHRFYYDLHVAGGFYLCVGLLVLALTGLTWSFGWYRTVFYAPFGVDYRDTRNYNAHLEFRPHPVNYRAWQRALDEVRKHYPVCRSITVKEDAVEVADRFYGNQRRCDKWKFDGQTGRLGECTPYGLQPRQNRIRGWIFALHEGTWGDLLSKLLTFLVGLGGGVLPLTGYWLYGKRKRKRTTDGKNTAE